MKQKSLMIIILSMFMVIIIGCENPTDPDQTTDNSMARRAVYPADAGSSDDATYSIWTDYNTLAGSVVFTDTDVTINTNDTYDIRGIYIYTWASADDVPLFRPSPGHADYSISNVHDTHVTIDILNSTFSYITVEVDLENGNHAYAGGDTYENGFPDVRGLWWGYIDGKYQAPR